VKYEPASWNNVSLSVYLNFSIPSSTSCFVNLNSLVIALFGSLIPAILSWFGVFVLVAYIFNILKSKN
jgi:hypothetical protein